MLFTKFTFSFCLMFLASVPTFSWPASRPSADDQPDRPAEIPFWLCGDNLVVVKGSIGNLKNLNIILDTGTTLSTISTDLAGRLNLQRGTQPVVSAGGKTEAQSVTLPSIDIGPLHRTSSRAVVQDLRFVQRDLPVSIAAVAGLDVLSTHSFMIDYLKRKVIFQSAKLKGRSVPFETQNPLLMVKVRIEGQDMRLIVDTGAAKLLLFRKRLNPETAKSLLPLRTDEDPSVSTAAGRVRAGWFEARHVSLGERRLESQVIRVVDGDPGFEIDGLLGLAQAGFNRVWLDFEKGVLAWD